MADYTRFPMLLLPYTMKSIAIPKELMLDYDTGILYVRSEDNLRDIPIVGSGIDEEHVNDFENPHRVTKKQIGLENVENYKIATLEDIKNGVSDKYVTPNILKEYIDYIKDLKPVESYTLTINPTPEDATVDVYIDNTWVNGNIHELNPGSYSYRVYKDGYITKESTINIVDIDVVLDITLELQTFPVTINTIPEDAIVEVYKDGLWVQSKIYDLPNGDYQYRAYVDEWKDEETTYVLTINPNPIDSTVEVFYNGIWNSGTEHILPNGIYNYRVSKEGYTTQESSVNITNTDQILNITLELVPVTNYTLTIDSPHIDGGEIKIAKIGNYDREWEIEDWITIEQGVPHIVEPNSEYRYIVSKSGYKTNCGTTGIINKNINIDVNMSLLKRFKDVALSGGDNGSVGAAITENGTIITWYDDTSYEISGNYIKVIAYGDIFLALNDEGIISGWTTSTASSGAIEMISKIPSGTGYKDIAISKLFGDFIAAAIKSDNSIVLWRSGINPNQYVDLLISEKPIGNNFSSICLSYLSVALTTTGQVVAWGDDPHNIIAKIPTDSGYTKVQQNRDGEIYLLSSTGNIVVITEDGNSGPSDVPTGSGYKDIYINYDMGFVSIAIDSQNNIKLFDIDSYVEDFFSRQDKYLTYKYDKVVHCDHDIIGIKSDDKTLYTYRYNNGRSPADVQLDLPAGYIPLSKFLLFNY